MMGVCGLQTSSLSYICLEGQQVTTVQLNQQKMLGTVVLAQTARLN